MSGARRTPRSTSPFLSRVRSIASIVVERWRKRTPIFHVIERLRGAARRTTMGQQGSQLLNDMERSTNCTWRACELTQSPLPRSSG